jgi:hypothetical protein
MSKSILTALIIIFAFPCFALAEIDTDLRFKLGSTAGADRIEIGNSVGHGSNHPGTNAQVEVIISPHNDATARFIMGIGLFYRYHPGEINSLSIPIKIEYSGFGLSMAPGLRYRISDAWNVEWKMEVGIGETKKVTLDSPGVDWNATKEGNYMSVSPIIGCYYLLKNNTKRVGLELGYQNFSGDFEILSNNGKRSEGNISGVNPTANIIYGVQF